MVVGVRHSHATLAVHTTRWIGVIVWRWTVRQASLAARSLARVNFLHWFLPRKSLQRHCISRFEIFSSQTMISRQKGLLGTILLLISALCESSRLAWNLARVLKREKESEMSLCKTWHESTTKQYLHINTPHRRRRHHSVLALVVDAGEAPSLAMPVTFSLEPER